MSENSIKNVFISHVHDDDDGLGKTKNLLEQNGMTLRDGSINGEKPNEAESPGYIKSEILAPRIRWAGTFIVYITPETRKSSWVDWEIEYAEKHGKRIVGIWAHGQKGCEVPDALKKYASAVVPWDPQKIMDALNGEMTDWQDPDGKPLPIRQIERANC